MALGKEILFAIAEETTYGTDAFGGSNPTSWLSPIADSVSFSPVNDTDPNNDQRATHSTRPGTQNGSHHEISFSHRLVGKLSAAGDPPPLADAFQAGNLEETINPTTSAAYSPVTGSNQANVPSCTAFLAIIDDEDESRCRVWLARGLRFENIKFMFEVGKQALCEFTGKSLFIPFPSSDSATPTIPTAYAGDKPGIVVKSVIARVDGTVYPIEKFELSTNYSASMDRCANGAFAVDFIALSREGTSVGGSITFKGRSAALNDILANADDGSVMSIEIELTDGTDTIRVDVPVVQFVSSDMSRAVSSG